MTGEFIGNSERMKDVFDFIEKAAPHDATVLICGESGTGKELVARAIHANSARKREPYLKVNCATLRPELLSSEMFGHEKGAFTGADRLKIGQFELAHRGTLFLDEVAELDEEAQAMLLRVLEEGEFSRLGSGGKPIEVDVRIVAATNKDLWSAVQHGQFREDLYYRLAVLPITIPPLRERREDIPDLVCHFISTFSEPRKTAIIGISLEAKTLLCSHDWPGNVRELRNALHHAVVMCTENVIQIEHLPRLHVSSCDAGAPKPNRIANTRRRVLAAYSKHSSVTKIAEVLDVHPKYLPRLLDRVGLGSLKRRG